MNFKCTNAMAEQDEILDKLIELKVAEARSEGKTVSAAQVEDARKFARATREVMRSQDVQDVELALVLPLIRNLLRGAVDMGSAPETEKASLKREIQAISPITEIVGIEVAAKDKNTHQIIFGECSANHNLDAQLKKLQQFANTPQKIAMILAQIQKMRLLAIQKFADFIKVSSNRMLIERIELYFGTKLLPLKEDAKNRTFYLSDKIPERVGIIVVDLVSDETATEKPATEKIAAPKSESPP